MIAGGVSAAVTTPLDVVKTRVMLEALVRQNVSYSRVCTKGIDQTTASEAAAQRPPPPRQPSPSVLSFPPRLMKILRNEGPRALFGGWVPRTLAISFGGAVFLGIYDFAVNFGKENKPTEGSEAR